MRSLFGILAAAAIAAFAPPAAAQTVTIAPPAQWQECAKEDQPCKAPANSLVRYGAGLKFTHRIVAGTVQCSNTTFGDPNFNVVKACAYAVPAAAVVVPPVVVSPTPTPAPTPAPTPVPTPTPTPTKPVLSARDKLGINVTQGFYWSREAVYANQARSIQWLSPRDGWSAIPNDRLSPTGYPKEVTGTAGQGQSGVLAFLNPPTEAYNGGDTSSRCEWKGTGNVWLHGSYSVTKFGDNFIEFKWTGKPDVVGFDIRTSSAANPVRDIECRRVGSDPTALFDPQMFDFHKPFGVVRFLDWTAANSNPAKVTWATRTQPGSVAFTGTDGNPLEDRIAFAVQNKSAPWETIPWNADDDYIRRLAQMYHDRIPAGTPLYAEISNEVWNYSFGVTYQAEKEGKERKLGEGFQAVLARYAQRVTEVMPILAEVYKDRPNDLVRVAASQAGNPWAGGEVMRWNNGAVLAHIDAFAIAPYFYEEPRLLTDDLASNMAKLAVRAKETSKVISQYYKDVVVDRKKRLIFYEQGQHQIDPTNIARLNAMNKAPAMATIYREYANDNAKIMNDTQVFYSATGGASQYGFWGVREYSGQPLAQTPKRQGIIDFANDNGIVEAKLAK